jgi:hypothetical protein
MMLDLSQPEWQVLFVNETMERETGVNMEEDRTVTFWNSFEVGMCSLGSSATSVVSVSLRVCPGT